MNNEIFSRKAINDNRVGLSVIFRRFFACIIVLSSILIIFR